MNVIAHISSLGITRQDLMPPINNARMYRTIEEHIKQLGLVDENARFIIKQIITGADDSGTLCETVLNWNPRIKNALTRAIQDYESCPFEDNRIFVELRCQDFTDRFTPKSEFAILVPEWSASPDDKPYAHTDIHTWIPNYVAKEIIRNLPEWLYLELVKRAR